MGDQMTKLCQIATAHGEYAVEIAAQNGLWVRARRYTGKWGKWHDNIASAISVMKNPPDSDVIEELSKKAMAHPELELSDVVPAAYRAEVDE